LKEVLSPKLSTVRYLIWHVQETRENERKAFTFWITMFLYCQLYCQLYLVL